MVLSTRKIFFINTFMLTQQPTRPFCQRCNISLAKPNGISKHGFKQWHRYCVQCSKALYDPKNGYLLNKKSHCEQCNFIPVDGCQLDLIYIDGNSKNKDSSNLLTICANCDRLYQKKSKEKSILDITVDSDVTI